MVYTAFEDIAVGFHGLIQSLKLKSWYLYVASKRADIGCGHGVRHSRHTVVNSGRAVHYGDVHHLHRKLWPVSLSAAPVSARHRYRSTRGGSWYWPGDCPGTTRWQMCCWCITSRPRSSSLPRALA